MDKLILKTTKKEPIKGANDGLEVNFEDTNLKNIVNKYSYKDLYKIINFKTLNEEQKNLFIELLEKKFLFDLIIDLNRITHLKKLLTNWEIQDIFLKDFIQLLNFSLKNIPQSIIKCINWKNEADTKWSVERPRESSFLNELFSWNWVLKENWLNSVFSFAPEKTQEIWGIIKYIKTINFILVKSNKNSFENIIDLINLIMEYRYKNNNF